MAKKKKSAPRKNSITPSPYDSEICWQCEYISAPELGMDMLPENGGYCSCKGWTDDIFADACELFRRKFEIRLHRDVDPLIREDWDNINKM